METGTEKTPVKPSKRRVQFSEFGQGCELNYRRRAWIPGLFLLLWLCGWTVGCVFLTHQVFKKPEVFTIVFAVPFWASWIFVFLLVARIFLYRERVTIDSNGVAYHSFIIVPVWKRQIPLGEALKFEHRETAPVHSDGPESPQIGLTTLGKPLLMFSGLAADERIWLAWNLNRILSALKPEDHSQDIDKRDARPRNDLAPPSDCAWQFEETFEGPAFVQRGELNLAMIGGALFINLFWNGIVSVFLMALLGFDPSGPKQFEGEWWRMFFFLIPFEAIGLVMLITLMMSLLDPFRRERWQFEFDRVTFRRRWLGLGYSRRYQGRRHPRSLHGRPGR